MLVEIKIKTDILANSGRSTKMSAGNNKEIIKMSASILCKRVFDKIAWCRVAFEILM